MCKSNSWSVVNWSSKLSVMRRHVFSYNRSGTLIWTKQNSFDFYFLLKSYIFILQLLIWTLDLTQRSLFSEQQAVMRLIRTLASDPIRDGTIDPSYTGQQHPDRYILGKYKVRETLPPEMRSNVKNHFPRKSHFKAHPAWLQAWCQKKEFRSFL